MQETFQIQFLFKISGLQEKSLKLFLFLVVQGEKQDEQCEEDNENSCIIQGCCWDGSECRMAAEFLNNYHRDTELKTGRFEKFLDCARNQSIVTRGSVSLSFATTPHQTCSLKQSQFVFNI